MPGKILTEAVSPVRQCAAVRIARGAMTLPVHDPIGELVLSRMFSLTTAESVCGHSVPWTTDVVIGVVPPIVLHAEAPPVVVVLGAVVVGGALLPQAVAAPMTRATIAAREIGIRFVQTSFAIGPRARGRLRPGRRARCPRLRGSIPGRGRSRETASPAPRGRGSPRETGGLRRAAAAPRPSIAPTAPASHPGSSADPESARCVRRCL